jgi:hypothetical protein
MSKKKIYILVGVVIALLAVAITLKSKGIIGGKDDSKEVEVLYLRISRARSAEQFAFITSPGRPGK